MVILCPAEFDQPNSDDPNFSALRVNFYADKTTSLTFRKNLKDGVFELIDQKGDVIDSNVLFSAELVAAKADTLTEKSIVISETECNHTDSKKDYCPEYERLLKEGI